MGKNEPATSRIQRGEWRDVKGNPIHKPYYDGIYVTGIIGEPFPQIGGSLACISWECVIISQEVMRETNDPKRPLEEAQLGWLITVGDPYDGQVEEINLSPEKMKKAIERASNNAKHRVRWHDENR